MSLMGSADASRELGVSDRRVRQMLVDGRLRGERIGRSWAINSDAVQKAAMSRVGPGRPWSEASAWRLLAAVDGDEPDGSPSQRSRARARSRVGVEPFVGQLANRARRHQYYGHPSVLGELMDRPGVVVSGVSALDRHGIALIAANQAEGYVRVSLLAGLVDRYALDVEADRFNVLLRAVSDENWPFADHQQHASAAVVAIDLLEAADQRSRRAGRELLERI